MDSDKFFFTSFRMNDEVVVLNRMHSFTYYELIRGRKISTVNFIHLEKHKKLKMIVSFFSYLFRFFIFKQLIVPKCMQRKMIINRSPVIPNYLHPACTEANGQPKRLSER